MTEPGRDYMRAPRSAHIVSGLCLVAMLLGIVSAQFSLSMPVIGGSLQYMAVVHKIMEMFSIVVSAIVVIISWYTLDRVNARDTNVVIFGFTFISANHMLHGLVLDSRLLILKEPLNKSLFRLAKPRKSVDFRARFDLFRGSLIRTADPGRSFYGLHRISSRWPL